MSGGTVGKGRRVLVIDARIPTPDHDAASWRMSHLLKTLVELGCSVAFSALYPSSWPPYTVRWGADAARLRGLGVDVPSEAEFGRPVEEHLRENGTSYDVVILSTEAVATRFMKIVRTAAPRAVIVYDTMDLHFLRYYREARVSGNARVLRRALETRRREVESVSRADLSLVVNEQERKILQNECPTVPIHVVTMPYIVRPSEAPFEQRRGLLFVGSLDNLGNWDAIDAFVTGAYPRVLAKISGLSFTVIGYAPPHLAASIRERGAVPVGHISDLAPWFDRSRISVAPLRFGAGIKGKVLLSLSQGVPVVATPIAAEGLGLVTGQDAIIVDGPDAYAEAVVALHEDERLWRYIAGNGLAVVAERFSAAVFQSQLRSVLLSIESHAAS